MRSLDSVELSRLACVSRHFGLSTQADSCRSIVELAVHKAVQGVVPPEDLALLDGPLMAPVLCMAEFGITAPGVLRDVGGGREMLEHTGWTTAFDQPYSHPTSDVDMDAVPADARVVMLAAENDDGHLALAAWGARDTVLRITHQGDEFAGGRCQGVLHRETYWYRWPQRATGFSGHPDLFLFFADSACARGIKEEESESRLSWNLDQGESTGGWRAGTETELGRNPRGWRKLLMYRM